MEARVIKDLQHILVIFERILKYQSFGKSLIALAFKQLPFLYTMTREK